MLADFYASVYFIKNKYLLRHRINLKALVISLRNMYHITDFFPETIFSSYSFPFKSYLLQHLMLPVAGTILQHPFVIPLPSKLHLFNSQSDKLLGPAFVYIFLILVIYLRLLKVFIFYF